MNANNNTDSTIDVSRLRQRLAGIYPYADTRGFGTPVRYGDWTTIAPEVFADLVPGSVEIAVSIGRNHAAHIYTLIGTFRGLDISSGTVDIGGRPINSSDQPVFAMRTEDMQRLPEISVESVLTRAGLTPSQARKASEVILSNPDVAEAFRRAQERSDRQAAANQTDVEG